MHFPMLHSHKTPVSLSAFSFSVLRISLEYVLYYVVQTLIPLSLQLYSRYIPKNTLILVRRFSRETEPVGCVSYKHKRW